MAKAHVQGRIRRVGNSLALLIPASEARKGGLKAGQAVHAEIEAESDDIVGLLADIYDGPFSRRDEDPKLAQ